PPPAASTLSLPAALPICRNQLRAVFAIGVFGFNGDLNMITALLALQGFFQAGDDVACTMQVCQRRTASRAVDHLTGVVGECVIDGYSFVSGDQHGAKPLLGE